MKPLRSAARSRRSCRDRSLRPMLDRLETRQLLAKNLTITNALLVTSNDQAVTSLAIGERISIEADWTTTGLSASDSYVVAFNVDGVTINSSTLTGAPGTGLSYYWYLGGWFASPGNHTATITVDPA